MLEQHPIFRYGICKVEYDIFTQSHFLCESTHLCLIVSSKASCHCGSSSVFFAALLTDRTTQKGVCLGASHKEAIASSLFIFKGVSATMHLKCFTVFRTLRSTAGGDKFHIFIVCSICITHTPYVERNQRNTCTHTYEFHTRPAAWQEPYLPFHYSFGMREDEMLWSTQCVWWGVGQ